MDILFLHLLHLPFNFNQLNKGILSDNFNLNPHLGQLLDDHKIELLRGILQVTKLIKLPIIAPNNPRISIVPITN